MDEGVTIFYPATCVIDDDVKIAPDTVIEPFVQILGNSRIGAACRIQSFNVIRDTEIADDVIVQPGCVLEQSIVRRGATLGPFSHLRPDSDIGEGAQDRQLCRDQENASWARDPKPTTSLIWATPKSAPASTSAPEPSPATTTALQKHTTIIEDGAFIGSDSTLVAPAARGQGRLCGRSVVHHERRSRGRAGDRPRKTDRERRMGPRETRRKETEVDLPRRHGKDLLKNKGTKTRFSPCLGAGACPERSRMVVSLLFSSAKSRQTTANASATETARRCP